MKRGDLDLVTAGFLAPGMVMWWRGLVRPITKVRHLPPTERVPWPQTVVTFGDGYPNEACLGSGLLIDAAKPDEATYRSLLTTAARS